MHSKFDCIFVNTSVNRGAMVSLYDTFLVRSTMCSVTRTYLWGKALSFSLSELNEDALEQSHRGWRMVV